MSEEATQQISEQGSAVDILYFDDSKLRTCHSDEECDNVIGKEIPPELLKELDDSEKEAKKKKRLKKPVPANNGSNSTDNKNSENKDDKNTAMNHADAQSDNVLGKEIPPELLKELEDSDKEPKKGKRSRSRAGKSSFSHDNVNSNNEKIVKEKGMIHSNADNAVAKPCSENTGIERARELAVRQRKSITRRIKTRELKRRSISSKNARRRQSLRQENGRNSQQKKLASKENIPNLRKHASSRKLSSKRKKN